MNESHQSRTETHQEEYYEDEIELIDILRVIWKWKYLILAGTIVCGLIAAIISLNMRKIYSIDMILMPGILKVGMEGNDVYIDSPQNIKGLIDSGTFNNDILNYLNDTQKKKIPRILNFKVTIPNKSNTVRVKYETPDIDQGVLIQDRLSKLLSEKYSKRIQHVKNEYDMKLSLLKNEKVINRTAIQSHKRNIENIVKRIDELSSEIKFIKNYTAELISIRNRLLSKTIKGDSILSTLVYTNTTQQNLQLLNNYQNAINNYKIEKEDELREIQMADLEIEKKEIDIKKLLIQKNNIQNIQIIQSAGKNPSLIKPKTKLNVILALVAGLIIMIFLAFLLEYIRKYKKRESL